MAEENSSKRDQDQQQTLAESLSTPGKKIPEIVPGPVPRQDASPTLSDASSLPPPLPAGASPPGLPLSEDEEEVTREHPGRYTVRGVHGRGGQARVLLAFDEHIGRDVAIKELLPEGSRSGSGSYSSSMRSTPGMVRFLREARVTGQLEHPNIVPVHEVARRTDGTLFYTMRFVRGETLSKKLAACKTLANRLKLLGAFWDMCNAIAFAHSRGVVHRDIKPENTMVGEFGETVLLDWGIAKVKGQKDIRARDIEKELKLLHEGGSKTTDGTAIGTPSYMSPEQARGLIDEIDERSDVWGLGAVLYEILTGKPPYHGGNAMEIVLRVDKEPVRPVRELCPDAPPELVAVAEKALQRDKSKRYPGAKELAEEIDAYMTGGRVGAYRYSSWELFKRFAAQNKVAIIAAGLILAVILGALVLVSFALRNESRALDSESQARQREETALAQEHREHLVSSYHLAQAYAEKADRLVEDIRYLSASVFAAASLLHNPANPGSPFHTGDFAAQFPESLALRVEAASTIYRTRFHALLELRAAFRGEEVLTQPAFSPDGRLLAVASFDKTVRIWDVEKRTLAATLTGHSDHVQGLAFSPDGGQLASCGRDRTILVWNLKGGKIEHTLRGHDDLVYSVAYSPDGTLLASAGWDKTVRLWDAHSGKMKAVLKGHTEKVNAVAFSPDGRLLASSSLDKTARLWSVSKGKPVATLVGHGDDVLALAFSPDGSRLATGSNDKVIQLWDVRTAKPAATLRGHQDGILGLAFSPSGAVLASAGYDKTVRLWETGSGNPILTAEGHQDFVYGVAFSRDGHLLASAGYDRTVRIWNVRPTDALVTLKGHHGPVYGLAFAPDNRRLASSSWDKTILVWDLATRRAVLKLAGHENIIDRVVWSPNGKLLASASRDHTVRLWDADNGHLLSTLRGHADMVYGVAFSPKGDRLATSGTDKTVRLWDVESGKNLRTLTDHKGAIDKVVFSPDGTLLASASYDKTVRIWDSRTGEQVRVLAGHSDWISDVAFSADGQRLVSAGKDGLAIVWRLDSGQQLFKLAGHKQWVNSVTVSPDNRLIATGSDDNTVRVWSSEDGRPLLILNASVGVVGIDFSRDSKTLAVGDGNDVILYPMDFSALDADPKKLFEAGEKAAGVNLEGFQLNVAQ